MSYLAFLISVAFVPVFYTGAFNPRWALLAVGVPLLLCFVKVRWTWTHTALAIFLGWCVYVLSWSPFPYDAIPTFAALLAFGGAFLLGHRQKDGRALIIGLSVGVAVNACFALDQYLGDPIWTLTGIQKWSEFSPPSGLFSNRNMLAEIVTLVIVGCVVYRFWYGLPFALLALFTSWSRTAFVAIGAASVVWLWQKDRLLACAIVLFGVCMMPTVIRIHSDSVDERRTIWTDTVKAVTMTGAGLGSFAQNYPLLANHQTMQERPENVHNDYLELAYETGLIGLTLFLVFLGTLFINAGPDRPLLTVMMVEAFFAFPLHMPTSVFLFGAVAGLCAARRSVRRVEFDCRSVVAHGRKTEFEPYIVAAGGTGASVELYISQGGGARSYEPYAKGQIYTADQYAELVRQRAGYRPELIRLAGYQAADSDAVEPCGFAPNQGAKN